MSEHVAHREQIGELTLSIIADEDRESPRSWGDELSVMVCDHRRYTLGDDDGHHRAAADIRASRDYRAAWEDTFDFGNGPDLFAAIGRCTDIVMLPLYLYDHSGITIATTPFSCPWDSGQVGFIYMTKQRALAAFEVRGTRLTAAIKSRTRAFLASDVAIYDQYLTGDVWGYVIEQADGLPVDDGSLWGIYGFDDALAEGRAAACA